MITVSKKLLDELSKQAKKSTRKRMAHRLHEHSDPVLKLLNALEPGTYVPPHKHSQKDRQELFIAIRGRIAVVFFDGSGKIKDNIIIGPKEQTIMIEVPVNAWHTTISLIKGSIILEVIKGPYNVDTHKIDPPWAPLGNDPDAVGYLHSLVTRLKL